MPDADTQTGTEEPTEYYRAEDAAALTARPISMIYRYIRDGLIDHIDDPEDGRRKLIPWTALATIIHQPKRGYRRRRVQLTLPNGTVITRVVPMPVATAEKEG